MFGDELVVCLDGDGDVLDAVVGVVMGGRYHWGPFVGAGDELGEAQGLGEAGLEPCSVGAGYSGEGGLGGVDHAAVYSSRASS